MGWFQQLFSRRRRYEELSESIREHLDEKIADLMDSGMTQEQAESAARRGFGNVTRIEEQGREVWQWPTLESIWADAQYALRALWKSPGFAITAVLTLAIGIGSVAAVFEIVHSVLLKPLPFSAPEQIVSIWSVKQGHKDFVTPRNFDSWRRGTQSYQEVAALERSSMTLSDHSSATQIVCGQVSFGFFSVFGVPAEIGRTFTHEEDLAPRQHFVILSHRLWKERFSAGSDVLGKQIQLNREPYTVIGVMPALLDLRPDGEQAWIPLALSGQEMNWSGGVLYVFGRLRPHVTIAQAQAEMKVQATLLANQYPEMNRNRGIEVTSFASDLVGDYRQQLWILLGAVGCVFLIACANAANLLLARTMGRQRELMIRVALGASRIRVIRQLLVETFLMGLASAVLGLIFTAAAIEVAKRLADHTIPRLDTAGIDLTVLVSLSTLAVLCTLLSGTAPALQATKLHGQEVMLQGGRSVTGGIRRQTKNVYVAFEVGLALILLVAAGLLIRTAINAQRVKPGFIPDRVIAARTALPPALYSTATQSVAVYQRILDDLMARPGVQSAALSSQIPMTPSNLGLAMKADALMPPLQSDTSTTLEYVSPDYFSLMRIPFVHGRAFTADDKATTTPTVIVNRTLATKLWSDVSVVGKSLRLPELEGSSPNWQVVGVVEDVHNDGLMQPPPPVLYIPVAQVSINPWHWSEQSLYIFAKTQTESLATPELLRTSLNKVDAGLPLGDSLTMNQRLAQSLSNARFYSLLLAALGLCALILTGVGIYGVLAYFVSQERTEIGVRMALGASRINVLMLVLRRGMTPVAVGAFLGILVSVAASRTLVSFLFGVGTLDVVTFVSVVLVLIGTALAACYFPARRASRIDPMIAIRGE